jgi:hypothetical protein
MNTRPLTVNPYSAWRTDQLPKLKNPTNLILEEACNGIPVRTPNGHGTNFVSHIPSRKMSTVIISESRSVEMKACYIQELLPCVKAYYCQPYTFNIRRVNSLGIEQSTCYTPDFLSIVEATDRNLHYILIECKKVSSMLSKPGRFSRGTDGRWKDHEASEQLNELGFHLSVFSDEDVTPILKKNLSLLMPQMRAALQFEKCQ